MTRMKLSVALTLLLLAPFATAQTTVDETKAAKPEGLVEISNVSGSVDVIGWDKAEVHVAGTLEKNVERMDFDVRNGRTKIEVVLPKFKHGQTSAQLTIHVPAGSRLDVDTVSASVRVENPTALGLEPIAPAAEKNPPAEKPTAEVEVAGPEAISIQTVSGEIDVKAGAEEVHLKTVSGDVHFHGAAERLKAQTVSGDLECSGAIGSLTGDTISGDAIVNGIQREAEVSTVSGKTKLAFTAIQKASINSMSGDISLEGPLAQEGRIAADTQSGDITIRFQNEISAECEANTLSGDIKADLGGGITPPVEKKVPGRALHFSVGTGAGHIHLTTVSGDIALLR